MNVTVIVKDYLRKIGADGLCREACGCGLDDFAPCGDGPLGDCVPACRTRVPPGKDLVDARNGKPVDLSEFDAGDEVFLPINVPGDDA